MANWDAWYALNREDERRGVATYTAVTDPAVLAVLDVIAPRDPDGDDRSPIFEFGHETTPTRIEMVELAERIADAVRASLFDAGAP